MLNTRRMAARDNDSSISIHRSVSPNPSINRSLSNLKVRLLNEPRREVADIRRDSLRKIDDMSLNDSSDVGDARSINIAGRSSDLGSVRNSQRMRSSARLIKTRLERQCSTTMEQMGQNGLAFEGLEKVVPKDGESEIGNEELEFPPAPPIPPRPEELNIAEKSLRTFSAIAKSDPLVNAHQPILPQRYFYGKRQRFSKENRGGNNILKCKVVNVGPDTPKLQLPAYTVRLIELVKQRRSRLEQIRRGACMFTHENLTILEHELETYERGLKNAMRMLSETSNPKTVPASRPQLTNEFGTKVLRPTTSQAVLRGKQVRFSLEDFMADLSVSGVTDLLSSSSDVTSVLEEEVEELRKSLRQVREDIAYILEEEDLTDEGGPLPLQHIRATRQCSIHSLSSA